MSKPVCVVVGVGPGNGEAFARRFSSEGHAVALLSRSTDFTEGLASELEDAKAYACDAADPEAMARTFAAIRDDLGDVDVLLYNAGSGTWGSLEDVAPEAFETAWRVGLFHAAREVIGPMKAKGVGSIVVTGATASLRGKPMTTAFASAKAAQKSLAESLARTYGPDGVHVSLVIVDGMIDLPRTRERMPGKPDEDFLAPDDIAHTVFHLATQPKSAWSFQVDLRPFTESW